MDSFCIVSGTSETEQYNMQKCQNRLFYAVYFIFGKKPVDFIKSIYYRHNNLTLFVTNCNGSFVMTFPLKPLQKNGAQAAKHGN